jgi:hypothetical protein
METGQLSAAVSALKEKGVLSGKRVERSEIGALRDGAIVFREAYRLGCEGIVS